MPAADPIDHVGQHIPGVLVGQGSHRRLMAIARGFDDRGRTLDQCRADLVVDSLLDAGRDPADARDPADTLDPGVPDALPSGDSRSGDNLAGGIPAVDSPAGAHSSCPSSATPSNATPSMSVPPSAPRTAPLLGDSRPEICVVVGLDTLLGLADGASEVPGLGPIPAEVARALAADGRWRAWITDAASSVVVATGSRRYRPGPALSRLVRAGEQVCRMPGCQRSATTCDLDHTVPWPRGETVAGNLGALCRRHHQLKTHGGWQLESTGQGWRWRLPSGLVQQQHADPPLE